MSKKHSPKTKKALLTGKMGYKMSEKERLSIKIGRNERCPCKSGLKYKNCCKGNMLFFTEEHAKILGLDKEQDGK